MDSSSLLSDEQIKHFKTHGYLVLKNLFDKASLDNWRELIWRKLGSNLETPETWPEDDSSIHRYEYSPLNRHSGDTRPCAPLWHNWAAARLFMAMEHPK